MRILKHKIVLNWTKDGHGQRLEFELPNGADIPDDFAWRAAGDDPLRDRIAIYTYPVITVADEQKISVQAQS